MANKKNKRKKNTYTKLRKIRQNIAASRPRSVNGTLTQKKCTEEQVMEQIQHYNGADVRKLNESDDDMTQCDSQEQFMGENSQRWDSMGVNLSDNETEVLEKGNQTNSTELSTSSTQTGITSPTIDEKKMELANNAFGVFIGHELGHVPVFKRKYVMSKILELLHNNS